MEDNETRTLLERLLELNDKLSDDSSEDISFMNEINDIINKLNNNPASISPLQVKIKKLHPKAVIPTYSKDGDAGMDLTITSIIKNNDSSIKYGYGISMEIPYGYVGLIFSRSSVGDFDLILSNCVGVVDSGYRGEIMSVFKKTEKTEKPTIYDVGDRSAQIIIIPYPKVEFVLVDELSKTERNTGGFGHTGI